MRQAIWQLVSGAVTGLAGAAILAGGAPSAWPALTRAESAAAAPATGARVALSDHEIRQSWSGPPGALGLF